MRSSGSQYHDSPGGLRQEGCRKIRTDGWPTRQVGKPSVFVIVLRTINMSDTFDYIIDNLYICVDWF